MPAGDQLHLRRLGSYDGIVRGYRRKGCAAWSYGAGPLQALVGAGRRLGDPPVVACAAAYLVGWVEAAVRRRPRAERPVRALQRRELRARVAAQLPRGGRA
jgi:hypothetical protein